MTKSDSVFVGSIPSIYEQYLGSFLFKPYADDLVGRFRDLRQGRILETAAGTGVVTRALAQALPPTIEIVATDLNQAMLDHAAAQLQAPNVTWRQADAQALPFDDSAFDAVVCQFGVMFFPDKPRAYREALRVLRPGGRFVFNVWGSIEDNEVSHCVAHAVAALFPDDPPRFLERTPFGYFNKDAILGDLRRAGFAHNNIETVEKVSRAPSAREPAIGLCQGSPLRNEIEARDPAGLERVTAVAAGTIAERFGSSNIEARMVAHIVTAVRAS